MRQLNLGCSDRAINGYWNVDLVPGPQVNQVVDLSQDWPWEDNSASVILADDIIEHLPDKIHTMNEAWRVLIPGGEFRIFVPTTDGRGAFQDPTHVSYWNRNSFFYYTEGVPEHTRFAASYGIKCTFRVSSEKQHVYPGNVQKLGIVLQAVK